MGGGGVGDSGGKGLLIGVAGGAKGDAKNGSGASAPPPGLTMEGVGLGNGPAESVDPAIGKFGGGGVGEAIEINYVIVT